MGNPDLFEVRPGRRSQADWCDLLGGLLAELSSSVGVVLGPTAWLTADDQEGHASSSNCVNFRGTLSETLQLDVCGVACVTVNFGESVFVSADFLLFAGGRRLSGPGDTDILAMVRNPDGWRSLGWAEDENAEWMAHTTDQHWRD